MHPDSECANPTNVLFPSATLTATFDAPPGPPKRQFEGKRLSLVGLGLPGGMLFGVVLALILRRRKPAAS